MVFERWSQNLPHITGITGVGKESFRKEHYHLRSASAYKTHLRNDYVNRKLDESTPFLLGQGCFVGNA
jgi:hypothetical protein